METKNFVWNGAGHRHSPGLIAGEQDARLYFWNRFREDILEKLQAEIDSGWEPITEIGPVAFKLNSWSETPKRGFWQYVFPIVMYPRTWYEVIDFRVMLVKRN